ncbi:hypothetical protein ACOME3_001640 [Neoechinorhynchus agilis]
MDYLRLLLSKYRQQTDGLNIDLSSIIIQILAHLSLNRMNPFDFPKQQRYDGDSQSVVKSVIDDILQCNDSVVANAVLIMFRMSKVFAVECLKQILEILKYTAITDDRADALLKSNLTCNHLISEKIINQLTSDFIEDRRNMAKSKQEKEELEILKEKMEQKRGDIRIFLQGKFVDQYDVHLMEEKKLRLEFLDKRKRSQILWNALKKVVIRKDIVDQCLFLFMDAIDAHLQSSISKDIALSVYNLYCRSEKFEHQRLMWSSLQRKGGIRIEETLEGVLQMVKFRWIILDELKHSDTTLSDRSLALLDECTDKIRDLRYEDNSDRMVILILDYLLGYITRVMITSTHDDLLMICERLSDWYFRLERSFDELSAVFVKYLDINWKSADIILRMICISAKSITSVINTTNLHLQIVRLIVFGRADDHLVASRRNRILTLYDGIRSKIPDGIISDIISHLGIFPLDHISASIPFLIKNDLDLQMKTTELLIARYQQINETTKVGRDRRFDNDTCSMFKSISFCFRSMWESFVPAPSSLIMALTVKFIVHEGFNCPVVEVRENFLRVASILVDRADGNDRDNLVKYLDNYLSKLSKSSTYDNVRLNIVILIGTIARYLQYDESKLLSVIDQLCDILTTPSRFVQLAVANCLGKLVPQIAVNLTDRLNRLNQRLSSNESLSSRRGVAYGIAGIGKGIGIARLSNLPFISEWQHNIESTGGISNKSREGALLGFGAMFDVNGSAFEMFAIPILSSILALLSDNDSSIRSAADQCSRAMIKSLSPKAIRLVLPSLMDATESNQWRTKKGAVECLGMMAFCSPEYLHECLPTIVPKLIDVLLSATQMQLLESAQKSLQNLGSVTKNAYMRAMIPLVISAIQDPANRLSACMQGLRRMTDSEQGVLDLASTSLVVPVNNMQSMVGGG